MTKIFRHDTWRAFQVFMLLTAFLAMFHGVRLAVEADHFQLLKIIVSRQ